MEAIKNLLNQVAVINKKNQEIFDATGSRFNMFQICGVNHYENTHSAILAEFLNPLGTHGLNSKLLECFIVTIKHNLNLANFDCEKARVYTEYTSEEGRIDILIESNKKAIIIENKIYAGDQFEQLKRYERFAQRKYANDGFEILYLTLFGEQASKQSGEGGHYVPVSYQEHIINWLENCVALASRLPIVRETIIQYINHLKQLTNQDMNSKNEEEITKILSNIENLRAAKAIYQNYNATFNYLAEMHFNPKMRKFAEEMGLDLHYEKSEENYVKFYLTNIKWGDKCWIGFTFENNQYFYGICNDPSRYKLSNEKRQELHNNLTSFGGISPKFANWWPFYNYINNLTFDDWENNIINSDMFFNDCKLKIEMLLKSMENIEL
jgi:hypothetical protein